MLHWSKSRNSTNSRWPPDAILNYKKAFTENDRESSVLGYGHLQATFLKKISFLEFFSISKSNAPGLSCHDHNFVVFGATSAGGTSDDKVVIMATQWLGHAASDKRADVMPICLPPMVNRPVSQMRAPLAGLSRTSGELWHDYSNCYMFWT